MAEASTIIDFLFSNQALLGTPPTYLTQWACHLQDIVKADFALDPPLCLSSRVVYVVMSQHAGTGLLDDPDGTAFYQQLIKHEPVDVVSILNLHVSEEPLRPILSDAQTQQVNAQLGILVQLCEMLLHVFNQPSTPADIAFCVDTFTRCYNVAMFYSLLTMPRTTIADPLSFPTISGQAVSNLEMESSVMLWNNRETVLHSLHNAMRQKLTLSFIEHALEAYQTMLLSYSKDELVNTPNNALDRYIDSENQVKQFKMGLLLAWQTNISKPKRRCAITAPQRQFLDIATTYRRLFVMGNKMQEFTLFVAAASPPSPEKTADLVDNFIYNAPVQPQLNQPDFVPPHVNTLLPLISNQTPPNKVVTTTTATTAPAGGPPSPPMYGGRLKKDDVDTWKNTDVIRNMRLAMRIGLDNIHDFCKDERGGFGNTPECRSVLLRMWNTKTRTANHRVVERALSLITTKNGTCKRDWEGSILDYVEWCIYKSYDNGNATQSSLNMSPGVGHYPLAYQNMSYVMLAENSEFDPAEQLVHDMWYINDMGFDERLPYFIFDQGGEFKQLYKELDISDGELFTVGSTWGDKHKMTPLSKVWDPSTGSAINFTNVMYSRKEHDPPMDGDDMEEYREDANPYTHSSHEEYQWIDYSKVYQTLFEDAGLVEYFGGIDVLDNRRKSPYDMVGGVLLTLKNDNGKRAKFKIPQGGFGVPTLNKGLEYLANKNIDAESALVNETGGSVLADIIDTFRERWNLQNNIIQRLLYNFKSTGDHGMIDTINAYYDERNNDHQLLAVLLSGDRMAVAYSLVSMAPYICYTKGAFTLSLGRQFALDAYFMVWINAHQEWFATTQMDIDNIRHARRVVLGLDEKNKGKGYPLPQELLNTFIPLDVSADACVRYLTVLLTPPTSDGWTEGELYSMHLPYNLQRNMLVLMNLYSQHKVSGSPQVQSVIQQSFSKKATLGGGVTAQEGGGNKVLEYTSHYVHSLFPGGAYWNTYMRDILDTMYTAPSGKGTVPQDRQQEFKQGLDVEKARADTKQLTTQQRQDARQAQVASRRKGWWPFQGGSSAERQEDFLARMLNTLMQL